MVLGVGGITVKFIYQSALLVSVYLVSAKISLVFATVFGNATVFWAPGGIALAWVLLSGPRLLPAVLIGAYLAGAMADDPFIVCVGTGFGNVLETGIAWFLLRHCVGFDLAFNRMRDLVLLVTAGAFLPALASAGLGPFSLLASGFITAEQIAGVSWRWWCADVLSIVFFTPMILVFAQRKVFCRKLVDTGSMPRYGWSRCCLVSWCCWAGIQ